MKKHFIYLLPFLLLAGCVPPKEKQQNDVVLNLDDPIYQKILELQDQQNIEGLFSFLRDKDATYRYAASLAFGSIGDAACLDSLLPMLKDPVPEVRIASAFSLGKIGDSRAQDSLIAAFDAFPDLPPNNPVNAAILEAIGRCGNEESLLNISSVSTYRPSDTLLLYGQAKAIYHFALRGILAPQGTKKMVDLLTSRIFPDHIRLVAAGYVKRTKNINLIPYKSRLHKTYINEKDPYIKMDLAYALTRTADPEILSLLMTELTSDNDYRLKINIIKGLNHFPYGSVIDTVYRQLTNPNLHIAESAAQFLVEYGIPYDVRTYRQYALTELPWQVKSRVYEAVVKHGPSYFMSTKTGAYWEIRDLISKAADSYEKAAYIKLYGHEQKMLAQIEKEGLMSEDPVLKSAGAEALYMLMSQDQATKMGGIKLGLLKKQLVPFVLKGFQSEDPAVVYWMAKGLNDCPYELNKEFTDFEFLAEAKKAMSTPKDIETYNELLKLESKLQNKKYKPVTPENKLPVDWNFLKILNDSTVAVVETTKGKFEVQLLLKNAPLTCFNFAKLIQEKFYDGKVFHRVVPNFVIQTGCPRGDGFGSLKYTIRSEFTPLSYDAEGYVGMASAGSHTESSQWFVTNSQSLHLDGNYTVFGKIVKGMDVVHAIEIGDAIKSIKLKS